MALLLPLILPVSVAHTDVTFQTQLWNWNNAADKYLFLLILSFKEIRPLCVAFTFWVSLSFVLVVFYTKHPDLFSRSFPSFVLLNCPAPRVSWFLMDKQTGCQNTFAWWCQAQNSSSLNLNVMRFAETKYCYQYSWDMQIKKISL